VSRWLKAVLLAGLIAAAVFVLFTRVFPWVDTFIADPVMGRLPTG
jgi:hypothetical protein